MKSLLGAGLASLLVASASLAWAQSDCSNIVPPSPWGPNDQTGATNRVTPAVVKAAAAEIQEGKVIPMSYPLVDGIPLFGSRFTKSILTATTLAPGAALGENQLTYLEDTWLSQSHVGTHLDGLGHIGRKDCYFNQIPMGKFINQNYMTKLGLEHLKSFATRGVLVDMVKVCKAAGKFKGNAACKKDCLDRGTLITAADIQAGLRMYNVTLREGDILIVHTGWGNLFRAVPGPEHALQLRRARHRQGRGHLAGLAEDRGGGRRHLGRRGDPGREPEGGVHRPQHPHHRRRHSHHRERAHRPDGRRGGPHGPGDVLLQHDRAARRGPDG
jgi:kynurenine formamidase